MVLGIWKNNNTWLLETLGLLKYWFYKILMSYYFNEALITIESSRRSKTYNQSYKRKSSALNPAIAGSAWRLQNFYIRCCFSIKRLCQWKDVWKKIRVWNGRSLPFDLVRWGIAEPVLNAYLNKEKTKKRLFLANAKFTAGRDEYYPIPQREINFTAGFVQTKPG
jgi:hypothetical protein